MTLLDLDGFQWQGISLVRLIDTDTWRASTKNYQYTSGQGPGEALAGLKLMFDELSDSCAALQSVLPQTIVN